MGRSLEDWVKLAAKGDPHALAEAEGLARSAWERRRLIEWAEKHGVGDLPWRLRAADRLLEAAIAEKECWAFRGVANVRAAAGDLAGAREALEAGVATLEVDGRSFDWTNLAHGFASTLGDLESARMCLDLSRNPDLDCRAEIAQARAELLGERDVAVRILEGLKPADPHEAWTLGNAWKALGDPARALVVFETALAASTALRDVLTLARAFASHGDAEGRDRALDAGEALARTAADWLDVGESANDLELPERLRAALIRAEAVLDEGNRPRLAAAWLWLGEKERADALGPRGLRPDAFRPILRDLPGFELSATALFDDLRARLSDTALRDLAGADYGSSYDKHLAALSDLVATGLVPRPLPWEPGEVVRLRRWSEGDTVDHVQRALCCVLLCIDRDDGHNDPPILVESALALGPRESAEAEQLLAWLYVTADSEEEQLAALWALALLCAARDPEDPRLEGLADLARQTGASAADIRRYCVRKALWSALSARWLARDPHWRALSGQP